jgi:hypothetical protein
VTAVWESHVSAVTVGLKKPFMYKAKRRTPSQRAHFKKTLTSQGKGENFQRSDEGRLSRSTWLCSDEEFAGLSRAAPDAALLRRGQGCSGSSKNGHRRDSLPTFRNASQRPNVALLEKQDQSENANLLQLSRNVRQTRGNDLSAQFRMLDAESLPLREGDRLRTAFQRSSKPAVATAGTRVAR